MIHSPINQCIYCGSMTNLTDEHIFPYGLGGDDVLPKASCKKCAEITGGFEQDVLRGLWWLTRALLSFPSRRPKEMPSTFTIQAETKDGKNIEIVLTENEKFSVAGFPEYASPIFLAPREFAPGIVMTGHRIVGFGNSLEELAKKYNLKSISGTINYKGTSFARMLAKIAYGVAVARFGIESFEEIYVTDCILNKKDDVGVWVGGDYVEIPQPQLEAEKKGRNAASIGLDKDRNILVRIRLFSFSPYSPGYIIVVGKLLRGISVEKSGKVAETFSKANY